MKYLEIKREEYKEFFKWILEKEDIQLVEELDILLANTHYEPYIFYTKEIEEFLHTKPMKRIGQISQLGTSINYNDNSYHTRLEHCKGAYKNALDFWVTKCKSERIRKYIDESQDRRNIKNTILADLMEMLRHDDCHTMLSHALEKMICDGKVEHEDIGKRILLENKEYREALNNISPNLYEIMCDNEINKRTAFQYLKEGNIDFDRMDFVMRDLLYIGLPYSRELIEGLVKNCTIREIEIDGKKQLVPVYKLSGLKYIQEFLETRLLGYEKEYACQDRQVLDTIERQFCRIVSGNGGIESKFIRPAIINYMVHDIENIDLDKFLDTNDIKFYTEVLDIAMHTENQDLRELAILCLPSTKGLLQLGVEMLDTKGKGKDLSKYSEYELEYIDKLKELRSNKNFKLREELEERNKRKLYEAVDIKDKSKLEEAKNKLKELLKSDNIEDKGIIEWNRYINVYKISEPIYVEDKEGKIYKLDEHPELGIDLSPRRVSGIAINPALMRINGYDNNTIEVAKRVVQEYRIDSESKSPEIVENRMSKYKVGKKPYLIGFEEK